MPCDCELSELTEMDSPGKLTGGSFISPEALLKSAATRAKIANSTKSDSCHQWISLSLSALRLIGRIEMSGAGESGIPYHNLLAAVLLIPGGI